MNYKRYLLVVVAGIVLLGSVTSHYAITVDEIKNSISKYFNFNEDNLKKTIPAAVIALGIASGLYYWWTSRSLTKTTTFEIAGQQITQLPVYSQSWWWGCGIASSGYHTLLRGMQVVNALTRDWDQKTLEDELIKSDAIVKYFNAKEPLGIWRKQIIERRIIQPNNGNWLQDTELEFLWNEGDRQGIISEDVYISCEFTAIDDFSWINPNIEYSSEKPRKLRKGEIRLDKIVQIIQHTLNARAVRKIPYFHIFGMGDSYKQAQKHWFALVLYQDSDGKHEYFITDSMNKLRENDERVIRLINAIETPVEIKQEEI